MLDLFELDYFSILDIAWGVMFLVLMMYYVNTKKKQFSELEYYKYYNKNVYLKMTLGFAYACYYILVIDGGDTLAYWDGGLKMYNLFWKSPSMYFQEMFNEPTLEMNWSHFDMVTGYPPGWIYREKESWFISKIMSLFVFISFKSYIVTTLMLSYISSMASWKLFELVLSFGLNTTKSIAIGVIFIPSVSFWCSGINKDMVVLFSTIYIVHHAFQLLTPTKESSYKNVLWILFYVLLLSFIRSFMITTIMVPLIFTYSARLANKYRENKFTFYLIRLLSIVVGVLFFYFQGSSLTNSEKLEEAAVIQKDFAENESYTGTRYDLGVTDFSSAGMLAAFVPAVIAGFYRPFIWESLSLTLILNGLEGLYFLYLTFIFFKSRSLKKINLIRKHEFFIFAFFFSLLMAYMSGLTSGLMGVLVRFKAPLIPFLVLLLSMDTALIKEEDDDDDENHEVVEIKDKQLID